MKEKISPAEGKLGILMLNALRHMMGEDLITHLGLDYYQEFVDTL